jgi:hypothetical protein
MSIATLQMLQAFNLGSIAEQAYLASKKEFERKKAA